MGVDISLYVGPKDGRRLSAHGFRDLIVDLIASEIVAPPAALIQGSRVRLDDLEQSLRATRSGPKRSRVLLQQLAKAPYGKQQLAIAFDGFWLRNGTLKQELERSCSGAERMGLLVFALKRAKQIELEEFDSPDPPQLMTLQHGVALWGRSGAERIEEIPSLRAVLRRHFGPLVEGCSAA